MEGKLPGKFTMGRESSMAPERHQRSSPAQEFDSSEIESGVRLMYLANEGDLEGINEALDSGIDVNFRDIDSRTALHVAACQGHPEVVELLLKRGAKVDAKDRWGSAQEATLEGHEHQSRHYSHKWSNTYQNQITWGILGFSQCNEPLADAIYYKNQDVIKLLEEYGAKPLIVPMHVQTVCEIPEYEIDPSELDFSNSIGITKIFLHLDVYSIQWLQREAHIAPMHVQTIRERLGGEMMS
ncbi:hypothetical protein Cgig2_030088 [Carnegiea gigantea]|uniref:Uncharacterized protein n=1 Tax=Carnegiea gigantea TaxID=171969 RepID=A0A9Q1GWW1_9CARY|nr:hypothetical protein Cgig2_030088 [Carnegiea gigantea]